MTIWFCLSIIEALVLSLRGFFEQLPLSNAHDECGGSDYTLDFRGVVNLRKGSITCWSAFRDNLVLPTLSLD